MKVFISYSHADELLARKMAVALQNSGLKVWDDQAEILPGDNWAEKVAEALRESEAMVVLLTPEALVSHWVRREIDYALSEKRFRERVVVALAGSPEKLPEQEIPWILRRLKTVRVAENGKNNEEAFDQIAQALLRAA